MTLDGILPYAHRLLKNVLRAGDKAVDATLGNGHDTVKLAEWVGEQGHVYGFDIQPEAVSSASRRLKENGLLDRTTLFCESHANLSRFLGAQHIKAAVFNLGYLPGGDKAVVTAPDSTIMAIQALQSHLTLGGIIVLVVYPGHPEGKIEAEKILHFARSLDQKAWHVAKYERLNQKSSPPFVIAIEKAGSD